MSIRGTSRPDRTLPTGYRECRRCGIVREARRTTVLCQDCREGMTRDEVRAWAA